MKHATCIAVLGLALATSMAGSPDSRPKTLTSTAAPSVTHGNTRITLIHAARITSWSNQFVNGHDDQQGPTYAIPSIYLEFLVERLGSASAVSGLNHSTIELLQNGEPIAISSPVTGGGEYATEQYALRSQHFGFKRPAVEDKSRACILWSLHRGIILESDRATIRFKAGFGQEGYRFVFNDVPLY
jgi:hypothetical protein